VALGTIALFTVRRLAKTQPDVLGNQDNAMLQFDNAKGRLLVFAMLLNPVRLANK
jgi:hypothetical protein